MVHFAQSGLDSKGRFCQYVPNQQFERNSVSVRNISKIRLYFFAFHLSFNFIDNCIILFALKLVLLEYTIIA